MKRPAFESPSNQSRNSRLSQVRSTVNQPSELSLICFIYCIMLLLPHSHKAILFLGYCNFEQQNVRLPIDYGVDCNFDMYYETFHPKVTA